MADLITPGAHATDERRNGRRTFLRTAGAGAGLAALFVAGCDGDDDIIDPGNEDPTAAFTFSPENPDAGQEVTFDATGSDDPDGDIDTYEWDFGDESTGSGETVTHTYQENGSYDVTLTVTDDQGATATSEMTIMVGPQAAVTLDFSNDFGPLNYAYALEQLEAAFYARVVTALDNDELSVDDVVANYFRDLAVHEAIHRDFLSAALGENAIGRLGVDFSGINFSEMGTVLTTAQVLEDTGVSAYNGAGRFISDNGFLTLAGKIVSVEARHAAAIRAIIEDGRNFADLEDIMRGADTANALDAALPPGEVITAVGETGFVTTAITVENA